MEEQGCRAGLDHITNKDCKIWEEGLLEWMWTWEERWLSDVLWLQQDRCIGVDLQLQKLPGMVAADWNHLPGIYLPCLLWIHSVLDFCIDFLICNFPFCCQYTLVPSLYHYKQPFCKECHRLSKCCFVNSDDSLQEFSVWSRTFRSDLCDVAVFPGMECTGSCPSWLV